MVYAPTWEWTVSALFTVLAVPLAAFIFLFAPSRAVNRALAALLIAEALLRGAGALLSAGLVGGYAPELFQTLIFAGIALPWLHLLFLGYALDTRWTRPLRARPIQLALGFGLVATEAIRFLDPAFNVLSLLRWSIYASTFTATLGIVAAFDAERRAERGTLARRRARAYLLAFAARDLSFVVPLAFLWIGRNVGDLDPAFYATWADLVRGLAALAFLGLLAYGLLRVQIFDLDVRIHAGVKQGTIMTSFVSIYFLVNETAQFFFQSKFGPYPGIGAATLLVFALHPVQRIAEKIATAAVPSAQPVEKMDRQQRIDVYRDQVAVAWEDGTLSLKERRMLEVVRVRLGLTVEEAVDLERQIWNKALPGAATAGSGA